MKTFISTGGLGDALICLAKIQQKDPNMLADKWYHGTGQTEHFPGIKSIQCCAEWMTRSVEQINKATRQEFIDRCSKNGEVELLNTKITEMGRPFLNRSVTPREIAPTCIQMTAGRMNDSTKRTVSSHVVWQFAEKRERVVLIGPEHVAEFDNVPYVTNLTAKTFTILEALAIIEGSDTFIGQDGVCAYYAAFRNKKCIINYHDTGLINHYYNLRWVNVRAMFQGSVLRSI